MPSPRLLILSRRHAEAYEPEGIEICISISDPDLTEARLSEKFAAVLRLAFFDLLAPPGIALGPCDRAGWPTESLERRYPLWNTLVRSVLSDWRVEGGGWRAESGTWRVTRDA